jgi:hypothetical protein
LVDLDGDGHIDLLSGSWPGEIFFFKGDPKRAFAPPVKLKNKLGKTINIDGGRRPDSGNYLLIAGDAQFESTPKGQVIIYEGERIEVPEGKQAGITGTASTVHAVDWNGDGKLDLLVGNIGGGVYLVPNEGDAKSFAFGKEEKLQAAGKAISAPGGDAGPFAADWDGDGKLDLLVGAGDGSVWLYRNLGKGKLPELAVGVQLVPPGKTSYGADVPKEPRRGTRAKVCAADWNGDGKLDLLVGDYATQKPNLPEPTPEEKAEHDKLRKELQTVQKRWSELYEQIYGTKRLKEKEKREPLEKEMRTVRERMQELHKRLPRESETHGWIWLFVRQTAEAKAEQR